MYLMRGNKSLMDTLRSEWMCAILAHAYLPPLRTSVLQQRLLIIDGFHASLPVDSALEWWLFAQRCTPIS
jgi:hypothetical protein